MSKLYFKIAYLTLALTTLSTLYLNAQSLSQFGGTTGSSPHEIAIDASGNVYTTNITDNTITKITALGSTTQSWATVNGTPADVLVDASGNVYVCYSDNNGAGFVSKIGPTGSVTNFPVEQYPQRMALDMLGNIYITNMGSHSISKITSQGSIISHFYDVGIAPKGIATDANNYIYVVNNGNNTLTKVSPDGSATSFHPSLPAAPYGVYVDRSSGNVFVTYNQNKDYVSEFDPIGNLITTFPLSSGSNSTDITGDGTGNIYVSENGTNQVVKINVSTGIVTQFTSSPAFNFPIGIAFDASGYLYVANSGGNFVSKSSSSILPITLSNFTVTTNGCTAKVAWETATESNSDYYAIEASTDGTNFNQIAKVASKNSTTGANYSYITTLGNSMTSYFRIKAIDNDGKFISSEITSVQGTGNCGTSTTIKVSPNPTNNMINIQGTAKGDMITIYDVNSKKLFDLTANGNSQAINISNYVKGIYIIQVKNVKGNINTAKVVKQ